MSEYAFTLYLSGIPADRDDEAAQAFSHAFDDGEYGRDTTRPFISFHRRPGPDLALVARKTMAEVVRIWPTAHVVQFTPAPLIETDPWDPL